jgi:hypothetical protein
VFGPFITFVNRSGTDIIGLMNARVTLVLAVFGIRSQYTEQS